MRPLILVTLAWTATSAHAGTALQDDFTCNEVDRIGASTDYPWENAWSGDAWTTVGIDGVGPTVSSTTGSFGPPVDGHQNFLLTGHPAYLATGQRVTLHHSTGALGLVASYEGNGRYYACMASRDVSPGCATSAGAGAYLYRVDPAETCTAVPPEAAADASAIPPSTPYGMQLTFQNGTITCKIDMNNDGSFSAVAPDVTLTLDDSAAPIGPGMVGLAAYGVVTAAGGDSPFDDYTLTTLDPDGDFDGIPDGVEGLIGTQSTRVDSDGDVILDRDEIGNANQPYDSDGDGIIDALETDSDNDGMDDWIESLGGARDTDCDGIPDHRDRDSDGDGRPDASDLCPLQFDSDTDGDGDGLGLECDPNDSNPDSDSDGLTDGNEVFLYGTDPTLEDTDGGGTNDYFEVIQDGTDPLDPADDIVNDTDGDGLTDLFETETSLTNPNNDDSDGDGLNDYVEYIDLGTNPNNVDSDGDTLWDGAEVNTHGSNPLLPDTDGDTLWDGDEVNIHGSSPILTDTDSDTLLDQDEVNTHGTDPADEDTDGDSLRDPDEVSRDTDRDGTNDALEPDDDDDLVPTIDEDWNGNGVLDTNDDTDGDGVPNWRDDDDDEDGVLTRAEDYDGDGDPTNDDLDDDGIPSYLDDDEEDQNRDTDGDGIPDAVEEAIGSEPFSPDSDADGVPDADEIGDMNNPRDTDGDGFPDIIDNDDDGDGVFTSDELVDGEPVDTDGDGLYDHLDPDRDNDGVNDLRDIEPNNPGGDGEQEPKKSPSYGFGLGCNSGGSSAPWLGGWFLLAALAFGRKRQ